MNWLKQQIQARFHKFLKGTGSFRMISRSRGVLAIDPFLATDQHYIKHHPFTFIFPIYPKETLMNENLVSEHYFETNGLLDLLPEDEEFIEKKGTGDFAGVNQENFVHALSFSKTDIEYSGFIDDVQTTISQVIEFEEISIGGNQEILEALPEDEIESNISDSSTIRTEIDTENVIGAKEVLVEQASNQVYLPRL